MTSPNQPGGWTPETRWGTVQMGLYGEDWFATQAEAQSQADDENAAEAADAGHESFGDGCTSVVHL